jgi:hypothetical protein
VACKPLMSGRDAPHDGPSSDTVQEVDRRGGSGAHVATGRMQERRREIYTHRWIEDPPLDPFPRGSARMTLIAVPADPRRECRWPTFGFY